MSNIVIALVVGFFIGNMMGYFYCRFDEKRDEKETNYYTNRPADFGGTDMSAKDKETDNNLIKSEKSGLSYKEVMGGEKDVLQGLEGVYVFVNSIKPEVEKYGLTEKDLQRDTELQLRQHGIKVITFEEFRSTSERTILWIEVVVLTREESPFAAASIVVELHEDVLLLREPKRVCIVAATWHRGRVWSDRAHSINKIRGHVKDLVSEFINDYFAANPK